MLRELQIPFTGQDALPGAPIAVHLSAPCPRDGMKRAVLAPQRTLLRGTLSISHLAIAWKARGAPTHRPRSPVACLCPSRHDSTVSHLLLRPRFPRQPLEKHAGCGRRQRPRSRWTSSWTCSRPWCARRTAEVPGGFDGRLVACCRSPVIILQGPPLAPLS
jgi:hypothetical protein